MEKLLSKVDKHWARTLIEFSERDPSILEKEFTRLDDREKADIEMAALVEEPVDERIVRIAALNGLSYTLKCCLEKGYILCDEEIEMIKNHGMEEILEKIDLTG